MPTDQLVILALVQGITEFLPISSSAHLNLVHLLTAWADQGAAMDVAAHLGTVLAVMLYFRRDMAGLLTGTWAVLMRRAHRRDLLVVRLFVATLPAALAGAVVLQTGLLDRVRTLEVIAWANVVFAVLLYAADRRGGTAWQISWMPPRHAFMVGLAQALALVPGVSRAGVTMMAARALGYPRTEAARFAMLMAVPIIWAASAAQLMALDRIPEHVRHWDLALMTGLSFIAALVTIGIFMALLRRVSLMPFILYRLALSAGLLIWLATPGAAA